jgi:4-aminobutyrate aminotransferase-like enzyme
MTRPNIHVVHRSWDKDFPIIERAEGIYLYDTTGKQYIDGSGGSSGLHPSVMATGKSFMQWLPDG